MLLRALSAVATAGAAAANPKGAAAHVSGGAVAATTHQRALHSRRATGIQVREQHQQQRQQQQWLSAAVPEDVWLPTSEATICVIPAPTPAAATSHNLPIEQRPSELQQQQQQQNKCLVHVLEQGISLASAAPLVAIDTPGLLPASAPPTAAAVGETGAATAATARSILLPGVQQQQEPLQGLSAGTAVLLVVDGSLPVRIRPISQLS